MTSLFLSRLTEKYQPEKIEKILIVLHQQMIEKNNDLSSIKKLTLEERKQKIEDGTYYFHNFIDHIDDVAIIHQKFDFNEFFKDNILNKKKLILDAIYSGCLELANFFQWDIKYFEQTYQECLEVPELLNSWEIEKFRNKTSKNRQYKTSVLAEYDIFEFRIFVLLYNNTGVFIEKKLIKTIHGLDPEICFPEKIRKSITGKTRWKDNYFFLFDNEGNEVGNYHLDNLKDAKQYTHSEIEIEIVAEEKGEYLSK
jgi:hypothetical protein